MLAPQMEGKEREREREKKKHNETTYDPHNIPYNTDADVIDITC